MMEVRPLLALLLAAALTGSDAQLDVCGETHHNPETRIVGGDQAALGAWPWQVFVQHNETYCGGTLITNQWVLTAAQCVESTFDLLVALGTNTLNPVSITGDIVSVSDVVLHPNYNPESLEHDLALLKLTSPVEFTPFIQPVCLAAEDSVFDEGTIFVSTGWGYIHTDVSLPSPRHLREVTLPLVSNEDCIKIYSGVTDNMICAGGEAGRGTCYGDGGAPLMLEVNARWVQAGVSSFLSSRGCAVDNVPTGFTRVSKFQQWIRSTTSGVTGSESPGFIRAGSPGLAPVAPLLGAALVLSSVLVLS
ncbi:uncharacterized protein V6R79_019281 [Siganus canaliculatus]